MTLTATFDADHGFVRLVGLTIPQDYFIYRLSPAAANTRYGRRLPAFDYTTWRQDQTAADYLAPIGEALTYGLMKKADDDIASALQVVTITTPPGHAYLRHLFYPSLGIKVRVLKFDDRRPSRLTTYTISGAAKSMATYDVRNGREATLELAVDGKAERDDLEKTLKDGAPISLAMCTNLGNDAGIFAVGDVTFTRWGTRDRWIVSLDLTEVAMPVILGSLDPDEIPGSSYDDRQTQLGPGGTYDDAATRWPAYYLAMV